MRSICSPRRAGRQHARRPAAGRPATARLDPVDVDPGRERDVDLIDRALAAEHGLRAEHVHQQQVAAERAPDAARRQDAAHGEGADADRRAQPRASVPTWASSRRAKTSVRMTLAGSTRKERGSSTTWSPERTRRSVLMAWPSVTSAAKTESASPAAGPSTTKNVSVRIGTACATPGRSRSCVGDRLGERRPARAPGARRCRPGRRWRR